MNMIIQIGMLIPKCVRVEAEVTQDPPHALRAVAAEVPQNRFASSRMTRQFTHDHCHRVLSAGRRIGTAETAAGKIRRQCHLQNPTAMNTPTRRCELNDIPFIQRDDVWQY